MIHLGYETGTGKAVAIPLAHMAVTGLTQQSGKTVTMESLIDRGDLRAVVFVTKPGEKSFTKGRKILPFFKERADWEYVKELLEARRNESLSKWDGYLMRVCRHARTLQGVRDNVEDELPKKKSVRPSHYEVLAGYLDLIIPELERVPYTDKLELRRGVNIMDLTQMSDDMKNMVIRSTIEHIHKREHNTVLVMPEAWKFIPEGGCSAVFEALQGLIREGATNGNFVWIDAQDLAIVSKRILKSVSVWILGKQQEANEVARTINHLIEPLHIRPDMIKSLGIGQFLVCGEGTTKKVYVQPWWLGELDALAIARGEESVETAQAIFRQKKRELAAAPPRQVQIMEQEKPDRAKTENSGRIVDGTTPITGTDVRGGGGTGQDGDDPNSQQAAIAARAGRIVEGIGKNVETEESVQQPSAMEPAGDQKADRIAGTGIENGNVGGGADRGADEGEEESMWKEKYETLKSEHRTLIAAHDALARRVAAFERREFESGADVPDEDGAAHSIAGAPLNGAREEIYRYIVNRAEKDPRLLKLLTTKRELIVQIETPVLEVDGATLRGSLALLLHKGFFSAPKNGNTAFNELQRLGRKIAKPNVYRELDNLAELGFLTKEDGGYQSTDLKVTVRK